MAKCDCKDSNCPICMNFPKFHKPTRLKTKFVDKVCSCDEKGDTGCPECTMSIPVSHIQKLHRAASPCRCDGPDCPICQDLPRVHPPTESSGTPAKSMREIQEGSGPGQEGLKVKNGVILKTMINKALSEVEGLLYYNCEHPCNLVLRFGIDWCECNKHERPHPALAPSCPDYTKDMIACLRVADALKLMVVFNFIDGQIIIRKSIDRPGIKKEILFGGVALTLSIMLYEMIQRGKE